MSQVFVLFGEHGRPRELKYGSVLLGVDPDPHIVVPLIAEGAPVPVGASKIENLVDNESCFGSPGMGLVRAELIGVTNKTTWPAPPVKCNHCDWLLLMACVRHACARLDTSPSVPRICDTSTTLTIVGIAIADTIRRIASTTNSSRREKPRHLRWGESAWQVCLLRCGMRPPAQYPRS